MANAQERTTERWRGLLKQPIQVPADKAWNVLRDFCGVSKWFKTITVCDLIEGEEGKPGCVRFVSGTTFPKPKTGDSWAKERLLVLDDENRSMSYEIVSGTMTLAGYQAWIKLDHVDDKSALVTWNYETNPVEGSTEEQIEQLVTSKYRAGLKYLEEYATS